MVALLVIGMIIVALLIYVCIARQSYTKLR